MTTEIAQRVRVALDDIENAEQVAVLYACESGSRAWGFESDDSDYDIRLVYVCPAERYLTIRNRREVIERSLEGRLDISGWDLPKTLELFRKSNPPLLEWLRSPIVYRERSSFVERLRGLIPDYYSPLACMYHYLKMAQGNYREYLQGEEVWLKKYLYVLRPVLACLWIERGLGAVPMEFAVLVDRLVEEPGLRRAVRDLVAAKRRGTELGRGPRVPAISLFLDTELARLAAREQKPARNPDPEALDRVFRETLIEVYGPQIVRPSAVRQQT